VLKDGAQEVVGDLVEVGDGTHVEGRQRQLHTPHTWEGTWQTGAGRWCSYIST
jgi:hypothetical protein